MTLVVNLFSSSSEVYLQMLMESMVRLSRHTQPKCNGQSQYGQIMHCGLIILIVSLVSLCHLRITTQLRSGTVDKMAGAFTKRIWQHYLFAINFWNEHLSIQFHGCCFSMVILPVSVTSWLSWTLLVWTT